MNPNGRCRSCGAPIRWCKTAAGRSIPIDVTPDLDRGNVFVDRIDAGQVIVTVAKNAAAVPNRVPLRYVSHFVSCPDADEHRKPRR